jgi:hypothetical protein
VRQENRSSTAPGHDKTTSPRDNGITDSPKNSRLGPPLDYQEPTAPAGNPPSPPNRARPGPPRSANWSQILVLGNETTPGLSAADEAGGGVQDAVARGPRLRSGEVAIQGQECRWSLGNPVGQPRGHLQGLGRLGDALPLQERALAITEAALGPDHPDTAIRLAKFQAQQGRPWPAAATGRFAGVGHVLCVRICTHSVWEGRWTQAVSSWRRLQMARRRCCLAWPGEHCGERRRGAPGGSGCLGRAGRAGW